MPRCLVLGMLLLTLSTPAGAQVWNQAKQAIKVRVGQQDQTGVTVRGGVGLHSGQPAGTETLFRGQGNFGGSCENFDFGASLKEAFESLPQVFDTMAQAIIPSLPMFLLCSTEPVACDIYKSMQGLINATIQMKYAKCQQVQQGFAYAGKRLHGGEEGKCLAVMSQRGIGISEAMRLCSTGGTPFLGGFDGNQTQEIHVFQDALRQAGASTESQTLAGQLLGDLTIRTASQGIGTDRRKPMYALLRTYEAYREEATTALTEAVTEVRQTGQLTDATALRLSVPGQPLPRAAIDGLALLQQDPVRFETLKDQLATAIAIIQLRWRCGALEAELRAALDSNPHVTDAQRRAGERELQDLRLELAETEAKVQAINQHLRPALTAVLVEAEAIKQAANQAAIRASATRTPTMPYRTQAPSGYSQ